MVAAGDVIFASDVNDVVTDQAALNPLIKTKAADDSYRTSNITPADDADLQVAVAANTVYVFQGYVICQAISNTPDLRVDFDVPASATLTRSMFGQSTAGTGASGSWDSGVGSTASGDDTRMALTSLVAYPLLGVLRVAGTAGTFKLRYAQSTSSADGIRLCKDSWIMLTPVPS